MTGHVVITIAVRTGSIRARRFGTSEVIDVARSVHTRRAQNRPGHATRFLFDHLLCFELALSVVLDRSRRVLLAMRRRRCGGPVRRQRGHQDESLGARMLPTKGCEQVPGGHDVAEAEVLVGAALGHASYVQDVVRLLLAHDALQVGEDGVVRLDRAPCGGVEATPACGSRRRPNQRQEARRAAGCR